MSRATWHFPPDSGIKFVTMVEPTTVYIDGFPCVISGRIANEIGVAEGGDIVHCVWPKQWRAYERKARLFR